MGDDFVDPFAANGGADDPDTVDPDLLDEGLDADADTDEWE